MSTDPADKEREFITEIEAETGRDLAAWMRAIDAERRGDRNATIDWLKAHHVFFRRASRAMWLERIHHNGGRPIYDGAIGDLMSPVEPKRSPRVERQSVVEPPPTVANAGAGSADTAAPATLTPARSDAVVAASPTEIDALLARGKAYRPLAALVLTEIRKALPAVITGVGGDLIVLGHPALFAAIESRPKQVRVGLALADGGEGLEKSKLTGAPTAITLMRVLTDARTVDAALMDLVRRAAVAAR